MTTTDPKNPSPYTLTRGRDSEDPPIDTEPYLETPPLADDDSDKEE